MTPIQWITNGEVGTSSKTIWSVLIGAVTGNESWHEFGTPHDADDFRRCCLLLKEIPEFRQRLPEVGAKFPWWVPLIREWDRLEAMFGGELERPAYHDESWSALWKSITEEMRPLLDEGRLLDGWTKTSPHGWKKGA